MFAGVWIAMSVRRPTAQSDTSRGPRDGTSVRWSWVQFSCAFIFVGFLAFLSIDPPLDDLWVHLIKTFVIASVWGVIAARFGDAAWHWIVKVFPWL